MTLKKNDCARLYKETLCQECYSESIIMDTVTNGSDPYSKYSTYMTTGNIIKSAIVNEGCEIWLEEIRAFGSVPIKTLNPGTYHSMTNIDVSHKYPYLRR